MVRLYKRPRSKVWQATWTTDGVTYRKSTGRTDRSVAERIARQFVEQTEQHGDPDPGASLRGSAPAELLAEYVEHLRSLGRRESHVEGSETRCRIVLEPFARLAHVKPHALQERLRKLATERGWKPATANGYRLAVHGFFGYLRRRGWPNNPADDVERVRVRDQEQAHPYTPAEVAALLEAAPPRRRVVYAIAAFTGLRRSEIRQLPRSCVDLDARTLTVPGEITKNGKPAAVPLPEVAVDVLREWLDTDARECPFVPARCETLRDDLAAAGLPERNEHGQPLTFHSFRRGFATQLARAGVPAQQIQALTRHSSLAMVQRYVDLAAEEGRAHVDALASAVEAATQRDPEPEPESEQPAARRRLRLVD